MGCMKIIPRFLVGSTRMGSPRLAQVAKNVSVWLYHTYYRYYRYYWYQHIYCTPKILSMIRRMRAFHRGQHFLSFSTSSCPDKLPELAIGLVYSTIPRVSKFLVKVCQSPSFLQAFAALLLHFLPKRLILLALWCWCLIITTILFNQRVSWLFLFSCRPMACLCFT